MEDVEVLIAATNKRDCSFVESLDLYHGCIIANQSNTVGMMRDGSRDITFVTTDLRGVGKNRNLALTLSSKEYLLFADDDNIVNRNYKEEIVRAFQRFPDADIVIFNVKIDKPRIKVKTHQDGEKITLFNYAKYGACQIAIKRSTWIKKPVFFSELFGGGAIYSSGEDVLFLRDCIRKGYRIVTAEQNIVEVIQNESSWFEGYNEKFFFDEGALVAAMFPIMKYVMGFYFCLRFGGHTNIKLRKRYLLMLSGMKDFKIGMGYKSGEK